MKRKGWLILTMILLLAGGGIILAGFKASCVTAGARNQHPPDEVHESEEHEKSTGHGVAHNGRENSEREASAVTLTASQIRLAGIRTVVVSPGEIKVELSLTGEINPNQDRLAHIVPQVPGIVSDIFKVMGDEVKAGEVMAVLESHDLADTKSAYLVAKALLNLSLANFDREKSLWEKKVSSKLEYLEAKQSLAKARIEFKAAEQKLHTFGLSESEVTALSEEHGWELTRYEVKAPFAGTIIKKHITQREMVHEERELYTLCNLDKVWVIASVYERDIARVKLGQVATITVKAYPDRSFPGKVTWIADTLDGETRILRVRLEVKNKERLLKPGMFARVNLAVETVNGALIVPSVAIQTQSGKSFVFVDLGGGRLERRNVRLGLRSQRTVEVLGGVQEGEAVVTDGSFILKSELDKAGFEG